MKKTVTLLIIAALAIMPTGASAWGRLGHSTIAEIAERHLTPEARKNVEKYTNGAPLAQFSSWVDNVRNIEPYKTEHEGYHASIATPDCKSPLYIRKEHRGCHDGVSAMYYYRELLKDYKEMDDSVVFEGIKCMIHIIGDFHCLSHVRYTDYSNKGKFYFKFNGEETYAHRFYDTVLVESASGLKYQDYKEYADRLDTWNRSQIRKAQKGWAQEWFEDGARDIRPIIHDLSKGCEVGDEFIASHIGLAEDQIRKAGYQLAAALNEIFGK